MHAHAAAIFDEEESLKEKKIDEHHSIASEYGNISAILENMIVARLPHVSSQRSIIHWKLHVRV